MEQKGWYGLAWKIRGRKYLNKTSEWNRKVSVALLASRDDSCLGRGSEDETIADSGEGENECKLRQKVTCGGVCDVHTCSQRCFNFSFVLEFGQRL